MENLDMKQLMILDGIYRRRSVSGAAELLGLGQPAVSMALAKFRRHYGDALFVRTAEGMAPTPLAEDIVHAARQALDAMKATLNQRASFDPARSDRMFAIGMTDVGQRVVMPRLLARLRQVAPAVRLDLHYVSESTAGQMESGEIDLAIGFLTGVGAGHFQQKLFSDRFVGLVHRDHPRLRGDSLTLKAFEAERQLVVATQGTGHGIVDQTLEKKGIARRVGLRIPNYLGVASSIADTEYLAIVPERFGRILAEANPVKVMRLPFHIPGYRVMQHWHERYAREPGAQWLRRTVFEIFGG